MSLRCKVSVAAGVDAVKRFDAKRTFYIALSDEIMWRVFCLQKSS